MRNLSKPTWAIPRQTSNLKPCLGLPRKTLSLQVCATFPAHVCDFRFGRCALSNSIAGLAAHLSDRLEASKQDGPQETGCNDPSFQKSKAAVIAAIALHEKADAATIECVDNSVQVALGE